MNIALSTYLGVVVAVRLGQKSAFLVAVSTSAALLASAAAPSPLYPVYRQLWGFSAFTLTVIFAVYIAALLATLLTAGSLSDHIGRKPVVTIGLILLAASMLLFIGAHGVDGLIAARVVQGAATGLLTGAVSAMMVDLEPRPGAGALANGISLMAGTAIGSVLSGGLLQWAPWPRYLIFWILLAGDLLLALLVLLMPALPIPHRTGSRLRAALTSLRPSAGVAREVRPAFLAQLPAMAAVWALSGLYLSLASSIVGSLLGVTNHFLAGAVLAAFYGSAALAPLIYPMLPESRRRPAGFGALGVGVLITMIAALTHSLPADLIGSVLAGVGVGLTWSTVMSAMTAATPAERRGQTFAAVFIASYIAFSAPALIAGLAISHVGMLPTVVGYVCFDLLLVIAASILAAVVVQEELAVETQAQPVSCSD